VKEKISESHVTCHSAHLYELDKAHFTSIFDMKIVSGLENLPETTDPYTATPPSLILSISHLLV